MKKREITSESIFIEKLKSQNKSLFSVFWVKIFIFSIFFLLTNNSLWSQDKIRLSFDNASWTSVMSGKAVQEPQMTSYGFVVLTDGKLLSAYSENGKHLWDYPVFSKKTSFISVLSSDFILLVNENSFLSLINPSGKLLWSQNLGFPVIAKPEKGRDSRIFVQGKKQIACLGVNGVLKWKINTPPLKNMGIKSLEDGSLIAFLEGPSDEKSKGLRFTPFGEIIETISFAGPVSDAIESENGILLSFLCGGLGLVGVEKNAVVTKWAFPSDDSCFRECLPEKGSAFVQTSDSEAALILCNSAKNIKLIFFDSKKGQVKNIFHVPDISFDRLTCYSKTYGQEGVFLSDDKNALITNEKGKTSYQVILPARNARANGWNHIFYTSENHLVLAGTSWVLNGFRTQMNVTSSKSKNQKKTNAQKNQVWSYQNYLKIEEIKSILSYSPSIPKGMTSQERIKKITQGNYGSEEIEYASSIIALCEKYIEGKTTSFSGSRPFEQNIFENDPEAFESILLQLPLLGTDDYPRLLSRLVKAENNSQILTLIIKACGLCSYDPEALMLDAIKGKLVSIPARSESLLVNVSRSVYEICRFMGRPALYNYGMEIQKLLLSSQYPSAVREEARNNLSNIARMKM